MLNCRLITYSWILNLFVLFYCFRFDQNCQLTVTCPVCLLSCIFEPKKFEMKIQNENFSEIQGNCATIVTKGNMIVSLLQTKQNLKSFSGNQQQKTNKMPSGVDPRGSQYSSCETLSDETKSNDDKSSENGDVNGNCRPNRKVSALYICIPD